MIDSTEPSNTPGQTEANEILLMERFSRFDSLAVSIQRESTDTFKRDPAIRERLGKFAELPGNKALVRLNRIVVAFVNAIPFAGAVNVNLLTSVLADKQR